MQARAPSQFHLPTTRSESQENIGRLEVSANLLAAVSVYVG
jgi:hypothetical protein